MVAALDVRDLPCVFSGTPAGLTKRSENSVRWLKILGEILQRLGTDRQGVKFSKPSNVIEPLDGLH